MPREDAGAAALAHEREGVGRLDGAAAQIREPAKAEARASPVQLQQLRNEAKQLTLPSEMGERFQVRGFSHEVESGAAFLSGDLSWRL